MKSEQVTQDEALRILNALPKLGPVTATALLEAFDDEATAILRASPASLQRVPGVGPEIARAITSWQAHYDIAQEDELLLRHGIRFITRTSKHYPPLLRETHDPPLGLYVRNPERVKGPFVAIVGTRNPSIYGSTVAERLARELALAGFNVVSGLARGVDAKAHAGALASDGNTTAVLGCGIDVIYPPDNIKLYHEISDKGALISEFPFRRRADKLTFPRRNRIVSGMSEAIIVVESDARGGSMITAKFAAEQGRSVFAVPGRIDQDKSRGCHALIKDGATLLTSAQDVIDELKYRQLELNLVDPAPTVTPASLLADKIRKLSGDQRQIAECFLDGSILHPDQVSEQTGLPFSSVSASLMMLELQKIVGKRADGAFEIRT